MATPSDIIQRDTRSNQGTPSANAAGVLFYVSDEQTMERWSGSAWESVEYSGGSATSYTQGARVYSGTSLVISTSTETPLNFNTELWDTDNIFGTANPTRLTATTAGKYLIVGNVLWNTNSTGYRIAYIKLNGASDIAYIRNEPIATNPYSQIVTTIWDMSAGNYVQLYVYHNIGSNGTILTSGTISPQFMMQRIG